MYENDIGIQYRVLTFADEDSAAYAWELILSCGKFCKLVRTDDHRWQVHIPESVGKDDA